MQFVERFARQLAVARKLSHGVVHIALSSAICQTFCFEGSNHAEHLGNKLGSARLGRGTCDAQCVKVGMHGVNHAVCERANGFTVFYSTLDDFVVNVGDVANVRHLETTCFEPTLHHIKGHIGARMPHMAQVIDGHTADVHAHMSGLKRRKIGHGAGERVVNAQAHG